MSGGNTYETLKSTIKQGPYASVPCLRSFIALSAVSDERRAMERHVYTVKSVAVDQYEFARPPVSDHAYVRFYCCVDATCAGGRWRGVPRSSQLLNIYKFNRHKSGYYVPSNKESLECFTENGYWILRFVALIRPLTHSSKRDTNSTGFVDEGALLEGEYRKIVKMVNSTLTIGNERTDPYGDLD